MHRVHVGGKSGWAFIMDGPEGSCLFSGPQETIQASVVGRPVGWCDGSGGDTVHRAVWKMTACTLSRVFRAVARAHVRGDTGLNWVEAVGR